MRYLQGDTAKISFSLPITIGKQVYNGPLIWELADDENNFITVDPNKGAKNECSKAVIDAADPQKLILTRICDNVNFTIRASYPGSSGPCSVPAMSLELAWGAPTVVLPEMCITIE